MLRSEVTASFTPAKLLSFFSLPRSPPELEQRASFG